MTAIRHSFLSYSLLTIRYSLIRYSLIRYSLLLCLSLCAFAQTPDLAWNAEASAARPAQADIYRGETLRLIPAWTRQGRPLDTNGWTFTAWWSTNEVQWWSKGLGPDASHTVLGDPFEWTPEQDCGARAYTLFIRAASPDGGRVSYRANARLRLLDSPGAAPNALPFPVPSLDFSAVTIYNAPWLLASDWQSGSNALATAVQALGPRLDSIETEAADWRAAFAWGPHFAAGYLLPADLAPYATTQQVAAASNALAQADAAHAAQRNPHGTTAADVGAITNEQDLAALRTYHYGDPNIVESPAEWFEFDASMGAITGFNYAPGRENVVIPWEIGGVAVTMISEFAFSDIQTYQGYPIVSLSAPRTLTTVDAHAFASCLALVSVSFPQLTSLDSDAFSVCESLISVSIGQNAPDEAAYAVFYEAPATIYVTNPQATGWGSTWNERPVVRPDLHADNLYQGGERAATESYVVQRIAAVPTNYVPLAEKELHRDSHTNLIWKSVYSNGWHFLVAYTNTPSGGGE